MSPMREANISEAVQVIANSGVNKDQDHLRCRCYGYSLLEREIVPEAFLTSEKYRLFSQFIFPSVYSNHHCDLDFLINKYFI